MLSALICSAHSYPTMLLVEQLVHQRCVHPGPLVLGANPCKFPNVHSGYKPNCLTRVHQYLFNCIGLSTITDGTDYIFTLHCLSRVRGSTYYNGLKFILKRILTTISPIKDQSLRGHSDYSEDFPRYCPLERSNLVGFHRY
jgi:hypothetical protein